MLRFFLAFALVFSLACGGSEPLALPAAPAPVEVSVVEVGHLGVRAGRSFDGRVVAATSAVLSARLSGPVQRLAVAVGDQVQRGQVLVVIQPEQAQAQLAAAESAQSKARAAQELAAKNFERFSALAEAAAATELELDRARLEDLMAEAAVAESSAGVAAAKAIVAESQLRAPFAGTVVARMVELGEMVGPGRPLVEIEALGAARFRAEIPAALAAGMSIDQILSVHLDQRPELGELEGRVVEVTPRADGMSGAQAVELELPIDLRLPVGLTGRVALEGLGSGPLIAPSNAIYRRGGLDLAVVADEANLARLRVLRLGDARAGGFEVRAGLSVGDRVVVGLAEPVSEGTPLEIR